MVLPVQRFSPAPGIYIDRTGKAVTITGSMEMYGDEATMLRAVSVQQSITSTWTQTFPDGYSCKCNIFVRFRNSKVKATSGVTQIEAKKMTGPSNVSGGTFFARKMELNANSPSAFTWTSAHEFGHILGLDDRYNEGIVSRAKGQLGLQRTNTIQPGYEGNLMAADQGTIGGKNIADLAGENEPGYLDDDDQIRLWVSAHPRGEISAIPDNDKLTMIKTLMTGYFSDDDLAAVKEICAAVLTQAGAEIIRHGVDLTDLNNFGQRAAVQMAFDRMPQ